MKIKAKVTLGVVFLFLVILTIGGVGMYYLERLSDNADNILENNYETLEYTKRIIESSDSIPIDTFRSLATIEKNIRLQEQNITEFGEGELTQEMRTAFDDLKNNPINQQGLPRLRRAALATQEVNMTAIMRKNKLTQETAQRASHFLIIIVTFCSLVAFTFIVNFPGYVANPIIQLTDVIKSIARKNYEERISFDRSDEFKELADAFNQMAEKLDEYEHSNLAKVIFEKKRIETIINRMSDPVIGLDEGNKVIFANEQALEILALDHSEIMEKYAPDVAVNNDLLRSLIRQNSKDKDNTLIKAVVGRKENYFSRESITVSYTPTGEADRVSIGTVILLKNVTDYKELDLAKTNFIATISHELKTPIASLQMCVKLLQDTRVGALNSEQHSIVRTLGDEVTRLSKITLELLDLSQVETGNIKLNIQRASPQSIVTMAVDAVALQADKRNISIQTNVTSDNAMVDVDIEKTTWVMVNLLTNAIRHSHENGTVKISSNIIGDKVQFFVKDDGPGIEAKYLDRVFEKFFQVPGTPNGTGLGLAISKEFIEAQGGSITADSIPGLGCTFSFLLPRVK